MDDYIAKPVRPADLIDAVERQLGQGALPESEQGPQAVQSDPSVFDAEGLLSRVDDDRSLFDEVVGEFLRETDRKAEALKEVDSQRDPARFVRLAHTLKGAAATAGAGRLSALSADIEHAARNGEMDAVNALLRRLDDEIARFKTAAATALDAEEA